MKKLLFLVAVVAIPILTVGSPAQAQDAAAEMAQVVIVEPITGHTSAFVEGAKKHLEWVSDQGGTWALAGFEIIFGERTGQFFFFTGGHTYADFDEPDVDPAAAAQSIERNIAPHVENVRVQFIRLRTDLSMIDPAAAPRPFYEVITFRLNPGAAPSHRRCAQATFAITLSANFFNASILCSSV